MRGVHAIVLAFWWLAASAAVAGPEDLARAAKLQVGVTRIYDGSYRRISYPGGDVPMERGVCTDVIVRAYRGIGVDLQALVHEDMKRAWQAYPKLWGLSAPDANIDHRRVPNLATFFRRHGEVVRGARNAENFRAGDIVTWKLPSGVPHIGIVSTERSRSGTLLVVHNIGAGVVLEDMLFQYEITGHYRYRGPVRKAA